MRPLRYRRVAVAEDRGEPSEHVANRLLLLPRRIGRLRDDTGLVAGFFILALRVDSVRGVGRVLGAHVLPPPPQCLCQRVQRRRRPLAVDHLRQRGGGRWEELVHHVEGFVVEGPLGGVQRYGEVPGHAGVEQLRDPVDVDDLLLHAAQEVQRPGFRLYDHSMSESVGSGNTCGSTRCINDLNSRSLPRCGVAVISSARLVLCASVLPTW